MQDDNLHMLAIRLPTPIVPGDTIGTTAPSSGVASNLRARFDYCAAQIRARGFKLKTGECLFGDGIVSAPADKRAAELMAMMTDDFVHAVMPPWGGELQIETLPLIDWDRLARAQPKWFVGWSDNTTFMLPLLLRTGMLSLHGMNLMDAAFSPAPGAAWWRDVVALRPGEQFTQTAFTHHQNGWKNYVEHPDVSVYGMDVPTRWRVLGNERDVTVTGRLVGGCADVLSRLIGTPYAEIEPFAREHAPEGLIVYLENCEMQPLDAARCWQQFKLAGWFKHANAVLIGRSIAPNNDRYSQVQAIADALGDLDIPVIYDADFGHQPPQMLIVNGAEARLRYMAGGRGDLAQRLS